MLAEEPHGPPPFAEPTPREALSVHVVRIAIGEPVTEGFGPRRFTSYQLSSAVQADRVRAAGDLARAPPVACRRRFSEFLKLREELLEAFPGVVLPPLPEKQTVGARRARAARASAPRALSGAARGSWPGPARARRPIRPRVR